MSDQGDAGQWRPATNQNDRYSTPDETTGPLPAVSGDEAGEPGFPSVSPSAGASSSWPEDDAPTGGFPAVPAPEEPVPAEPPAPRSVFEPVERTETPEPASYEPPSYEAPSYEPPSYEAPAYEAPAYEASSYETPAYEAPEPEPPSFDTHQYDTHQYETAPVESHEPKPYGSESGFGSEPRWMDPQRGSAPGRAESPSSTPDAYGSYGSYGSYGTPPAPKRGVTAEDEAAENDFFASDDHPPMWDKVVAPSGPPPKPGKPSSGNLRLPEWMRDEQQAAASAGSPAGPGDMSDYYEDDEGHSRRPLYIGLGVLVAGLLAAGGVYALKGGGGQASNASAGSQASRAPATPPPTRPAGNTPAPRKQLPKFKGVHTKAMGRISDPHAGLSYPQLASPWAVALKKSPMSEIGFSASQFAVTEKAAGQPKHWARLMSAQLSGAAKQSYQGPGTESAAATELAQVYEARMFNFRHHTRHLANQPLTVGGHKGWLISDYVTYRRPGVKATGDVVALAVVDTGKPSPGVLFMSVPNTSRKLWPDVNYVVHSLRVD